MHTDPLVESIIIIAAFLTGAGSFSAFYLGLAWLRNRQNEREIRRLERIIDSRNEVINSLQDRWMSQTLGEFKSWTSPEVPQIVTAPSPDATVGVMEVSLKRHTEDE